MTPFFRRIRQKLANENQFLKYSRYAIGEIVLVVVGILIALQINNFNNILEQRKIEKEYLLSLQTEFNTNLNKINKSINDNKKQINSVEIMLTLFEIKIRDTINSHELSNLIFSVFGTQATYQPSNGVLTDIISSGNLNLIKNEQLRQQLASFESKLDFMKTQENGTISTKQNMQDLFYKNGSVRQVLISRGVNFEYQSISDSIDNKQLFSSIEFENILLDYYLLIRASNGPNFFGGIKEHIESILSEIDLELKQ